MVSFHPHIVLHTVARAKNILVSIKGALSAGSYCFHNAALQNKFILVINTFYLVYGELAF